MAGLETIHRVVEKIEVTGNKAAEGAFNALAGVVDNTAKAMGLLPTKAAHAAEGAADAAHKVGNAVHKAGEEGEKGGHKGAGGWKIFSKELVVAELAAHLLEKAVEFVVESISEFVHKGFELNEQLEEMHDKMTGLVLTTTKWATGMDPMERFEQSSRAANAMLDEFKGTAEKTATPLDQISALSAEIEPIWTSLGKNQYQVAEATDAAASAAKVLGVGTDRIFSSMQRIVETGKAGRRDDIGRLLMAQAHIKATDDMAKRAEKLQAAMAKVGEPVAEITKGTGQAMNRLKIMTDDILQRAMLPVFEKVGVVVNKIVGYLDQNRAGINAIVDTVGEWMENVWEVAEGLGETVSAVWDWVGGSDAVAKRLDLVWDIAKAIFKVVDLVGHAWKVVAESVRVLADPKEGMGKLNTLVEGFYLKIMKVVDAVSDLIMKLSDIVIPDWLAKKIPGGDKVKSFFDDIRGNFKRNIDVMEKDVAAKEKKYGIEPTTELGRREKKAAEGIGLSKEERKKLLSQFIGEKRPLVQIDRVEIRQDFRDQDPDAVMVTFTRDLERLGENALQSTVGGRATVFGPGGSH